MTLNFLIGDSFCDFTAAHCCSCSTLLLVQSNLFLVIQLSELETTQLAIIIPVLLGRSWETQGGKQFARKWDLVLEEIWSGAWADLVLRALLVSTWVEEVKIELWLSSSSNGLSTFRTSSFLFLKVTIFKTNFLTHIKSSNWKRNQNFIHSMLSEF